MKLKNGNTLYFVRLDMACGFAGTDFTDVVEAVDMEEAVDLAQAAVEDWIESFIEIIDGDYADDEAQDLVDNQEAIFRADVDSPEVVEFNEELHDVYKAGGGSFLDFYRSEGLID